MRRTDSPPRLAQLQVGRSVPLVCVVLDICYPNAVNHGFLLKVRGIDDSLFSSNDGYGGAEPEHVDIALWKKTITDFPLISSVGDVLSIEACNVREWNGKITVSVSKAVKTHVYSFDEQTHRYRKLREFSPAHTQCFVEEPLPPRVLELAQWAQETLRKNLLYSGCCSYLRSVADVCEAIQRSDALQFFDLVCKIEQVAMLKDVDQVQLVLRDGSTQETLTLSINTRRCEYAMMIGFVKGAVVKLRKLCLNQHNWVPPNTMSFDKLSSLVYYPPFSLQWKKTSEPYSASTPSNGGIEIPAGGSARYQQPHEDRPGQRSGQELNPAQQPGNSVPFNLANYQREAMDCMRENTGSSDGGSGESEQLCTSVASRYNGLPHTRLCDVLARADSTLGTVYHVCCQVALCHPCSPTEICRPYENGFEYYFVLKLCDHTDAFECYVFGDEAMSVFQGVPPKDMQKWPLLAAKLKAFLDKLVGDAWRRFCVRPFMHDGSVHFQLVGTEFELK